MTHAWNGRLSEDGKTFTPFFAARAEEVVKWNPPKDHLPGVLVTYSPGGKYWAGRGQQAYLPASYTVYVVTEAAPPAVRGGSSGLTYVRHENVPCSVKVARETFARRNN